MCSLYTLYTVYTHSLNGNGFGSVLLRRQYIFSCILFEFLFPIGLFGTDMVHTAQCTCMVVDRFTQNISFLLILYGICWLHHFFCHLNFSTLSTATSEAFVFFYRRKEYCMYAIMPFCGYKLNAVSAINFSEQKFHCHNCMLCCAHIQLFELTAKNEHDEKRILLLLIKMKSLEISCFSSIALSNVVQLCAAYSFF